LINLSQNQEDLTWNYRGDREDGNVVSSSFWYDFLSQIGVTIVVTATLNNKTVEYQNNSIIEFLDITLDKGTIK
jgi:hypothetical protein